MKTTNMSISTHNTLRVVAIVLGFAVVLTMLQLSALLTPAQAVALTQISDVLETSAPSASSDQTIEWTMPATAQTYDGALAPVDQFTIFWDDTTRGGNPSGAERFDFNVAFAITDIDVAIQNEGAGGFVDADMASDGCAVGTEDLNVTINNAAEDIVFEVCSEGGNSIDAADDVQIQIGVNAGGAAVTGQILTPDTVASYPITIEFQSDGVGDPPEDEGETRVMILDQVVVTAEVETNLTCTVVGGIDNDTNPQNVNGLDVDGIADNGGTAGDATATALDFTIIVPDDGQNDGAAITDVTGDAKALGQILEVGTNAQNGFLWTIEQDQNILSAIGADFDLFADGGATTSPTEWASPNIVLGTNETYGHYAITSNDNNLNLDTLADDDDFTDTAAPDTCTGVPCFAGNIATARNIFAHTAPADGDGLVGGGGTQNAGLAAWAMVIEATSLQEAAADYTNTLTHICTPTF